MPETDSLERGGTVDRDTTLQRRLDRLRERLVALKARRIRKGGGYYW